MTKHDKEIICVCIATAIFIIGIVFKIHQANEEEAELQRMMDKIDKTTYSTYK
jgi:hypothetical protein